MRELFGSSGMQFARQPAVVVATCAPVPLLPEWLRSARYFPARESRSIIEHRELAELDEVIAAPARAELRPGAILQRAVTPVTCQSASMTSWCRRAWNEAPIPKRVSRSIAFVRRS